MAKQYQQKTCLHLLHIICAHPSFLSIGTWHCGHFLMFSSRSPHSPASSPACSSQDSPSCQVAEQELQNWLSQVGQVTATPWYLLPSQMLHTVWHPDDGHQVRAVSRDTSVVYMSLYKVQQASNHYLYLIGKICVCPAAPCQ